MKIVEIEVKKMGDSFWGSVIISSRNHRPLVTEQSAMRSVKLAHRHDDHGA